MAARFSASAKADLDPHSRGEICDLKEGVGWPFAPIRRAGGGLFRVRSGAFDQPTLALSPDDAAQARPDCGDLVESCVRTLRIEAGLAHSPNDLFRGAVGFV